MINTKFFTKLHIHSAIRHQIYLILGSIVVCATEAMRDTQVKQDGEKSILYIGTRLTPINHETFSDSETVW